MRASDFFTEKEKKLLEQSIREAELNTSGEIRIHIETFFKGEVLDRAASVFSRLGMHKTNLRNGVLFYLAIINKQFAIIGDAGINKVVADTFWDDIRTIMDSHFRNSDFAGGLSRGIALAGEQLKRYFPHQQDDINELPNEISFEDIE
jgi:uncharacterized membrane protein